MRHLIQDKLILKFNTVASFPAIGEYNLYYLDFSTSSFYKWNGTSYVLAIVGGGSTVQIDNYTNNFLLGGM